ncbi:PCI domain-containing protein [Brasilonema sp. CT11]|nr:PCI domain-containing protein [Brasilonema sp. CT11]
MQDKADKISLKMTTTVLTNLGIEMDVDELECILANLIYQGMIKGYLAHAHSYLVVSKNNTFPPITG